MSLRRRVVVGVVLVALVLVASNLVLSATFESFLRDRLDRQLITAASPIVNRPAGRPRPGGPPGDRAATPGDPAVAALQRDQTFSEYYIALVNPATGGSTTVSSGLDETANPPPDVDSTEAASRATRRGGTPEPFTVPAATGGGAWRMVAIRSPGAPTVTVVGLPLDELRATLDRIRRVQVVGGGAVLVALGVVSWWMLRLGVHPLHSMAETADRIAAGDLSLRVDHPDPATEAGRLGIALNAMLERIEEAFRQREASEARVRRFAADASHELRTPLTSIQGYAELWRAGGLRNKGELGEAMRRMEQEARRMAALVDDLLLLARLDQRRPLDRAPVRLDEVVADAVSDARAVEPDRPIRSELAEAVVAGDEMRLRQVVANLLSNARVHTPPETPVHVTLAVAGTNARLVVADEGPGLDADTAGRVFERFYRADPSRARAGGGTGLGLSIVAAVAEAHGGVATVESEPGRGSRFVVELPLAGPPADTATGEPEAVKAS